MKCQAGFRDTYICSDSEIQVKPTLFSSEYPDWLHPVKLQTRANVSLEISNKWDEALKNFMEELQRERKRDFSTAVLKTRYNQVSSYQGRK